MAIIITHPKFGVNESEEEIKTLLQQFHLGVHQLPVPLAVSIGVQAILPQTFNHSHLSAGEQAYKSTDLLLYEAKNTGRDKIVFMGSDKTKTQFLPEEDLS
jgi:GGDEF domain-containing protein